MHIPLNYLLALMAATVWVIGLAAADRLLPERARFVFRCAMGTISTVLAIAALQLLVIHASFLLDPIHGGIAAAGISFLLYERHRRRAGRPVPPRTRRRAGIALGITAICSWLVGWAYGYPAGFQVWDQYHYYVNARFFPELGYDNLYRCTTVAMDEIGRLPARADSGPVDLRAEVRAPGRGLRNLDIDNRLIPAVAVLADPERCRSRFTPARWKAFKEEITFFRLAAGAAVTEKMQTDYGFNPPPTWLLAGSALANLGLKGTAWHIALGAFDAALIIAALGMLGWAFGWRVFAVAAVFWGTQTFSQFYGVGAAFLRNDWLLSTIAAVCLARRRHHVMAGAALGYAALLRIFPALFALGWIVAGLAHLARTRRIAPEHRRILLGGLAAAAVLIPLSGLVAGWNAWPAFYRHTVELHARTPIVNNMGLPVAAGYAFGGPLGEGRVRYTYDKTLFEPAARWKQAQVERAEAARPLVWLVAAIVLVLFVIALRRVRRPWIALSLSVIWPAVLLTLTCYYYSFLILAAPLTRIRRSLEIPLLALAAASQFVRYGLRFNDDRYALETLLVLMFCGYALALFALPNLRRKALAPP